VGLNLPNPISNWVQEKQFGQKLESVEKEYENADKRAEEDRMLRMQSLSLQERQAQAANYFRAEELRLRELALQNKKDTKMILSGDEAQKLGQMENAEPVFDRLGERVANSAPMSAAIWGINSSNAAISGAANLLSSPETQMLANAVQQVRNMIGRDLSGAAIAKHEWQAFEANIPKYGDSPEVLAQKKKNRMDWIKDKKDRGQSRKTGDGAGTNTPSKGGAAPLYKTKFGVEFISIDGGNTWKEVEK
jgi:hypothetical protein